MSISQSILLEVATPGPGIDLDELCGIWDSVVDSMVQQMLDLAVPQMPSLHIDLREETALELARLTHFMTRKVVMDRLAGRSVDVIAVDQERTECLGEEGMRRIHNTARIASEEVWLKRYRERWQPKTEAALRREANPRRAKLTPQNVRQNHYIAKSFIRRYWAKDGKVLRFRRGGTGDFRGETISFGAWGYREGLYGSRLEAYFGLM